MSQAEVWRQLKGDLSKQLIAVRQWLDSLEVNELWLTGAGSSAFIGDVIAETLNQQRPFRVRAISSTDLVSAPALYINRSVKPLVVSFGRSGNSSESVGVLNLLDKLLPKSPRLNITCNPDGVLATRQGKLCSQQVVLIPAHDKGFAMTASFSGMLLAALLIFDNKTNSARFLEQLAVFASITTIQADSWASNLATPARVVMLGTGSLAHAARESALKILELTSGGIPSLWDSTLGFRHGPKSFVDAGTHIIIFESNIPYCQRYDQDLSAELKRQYPENEITIIGSSVHCRIKVPQDVEHNALTRVVDGVRLHDDKLT